MRAIDLSFSRVSPEWCRIRRLEGFELFIQCLWTGGYAGKPGINAVAESNLRAAREAGIITAGYLNSNPWWPAATSLTEAQIAAGSEWPHLVYVFNDVEIAGTTEAHIKAHCEAITAAGKRTAIYSAKWFWDRIGNPQWPWLLEYPLWAAQYDGNPNAPVKLFGPWKEVFGKQYQGTTNLDGCQVDLNEFDLVIDEEADMSAYDDAILDALKALKDGDFVAPGDGVIYKVEIHGDSPPELVRIDDSVAQREITGPVKTVPLGVAMLYYHGRQIT